MLTDRRAPTERTTSGHYARGSVRRFNAFFAKSLMRASEAVRFFLPWPYRLEPPLLRPRPDPKPRRRLEGNAPLGS